MRPSASAEKSMPLPSQARPPAGPCKGPAIFSNVQTTLPYQTATPGTFTRVRNTEA
jgi:hypothetical protein